MRKFKVDIRFNNWGWGRNIRAKDPEELLKKLPEVAFKNFPNRVKFEIIFLRDFENQKTEINRST